MMEELKRNGLRGIIGLFPIICFMCLHCGVASPDGNSTSRHSINDHLIGHWTDRNTAVYQNEYHELTFNRSGGYLWQEYYIGVSVYGGSPRLYREGEAHTTFDSLVVTYNEYAFSSLFGYVETDESVLETKRFRFNDKGWLALADPGNERWDYFRRTDGSTANIHDTNTFCVVAMDDSAVYLPNTDAVLTSRGYNPSGGISMYLWSTNSGLSYDTTLTPACTLHILLTDTGFHIGAVRIVDEAGNSSTPDFFEFCVLSGRPDVSVRDTVFYRNRPMVLCAHGQDGNGEIVAYYWTLQSPTYLPPWGDTTLSSCVQWPDTTYTPHTQERVCRVTAKDNDSVLSLTSTFRVSVIPHLFGTNENDECLAAYVTPAGNIAVISRSPNGAFVSIIDTAGFVVSRPAPICSTTTTPWYTLLKTRVDREGSLLLCGVQNTATGENMDLKKTSLDGSLIWQRSYNIPGSCCSDVAELPNGDYAFAGMCQPSSDSTVAIATILGRNGVQKSQFTAALAQHNKFEHIISVTDGVVCSISHFSSVEHLAKFSVDGAPQWAIEVGPPFKVFDILPGGADEFVVCAVSTYGGFKISRYRDSTKLWDGPLVHRTTSGQNYGFQEYSGTYVMLGGDKQMFVIQVDSLGQFLRERCYTGDNMNWYGTSPSYIARSLLVAPDGGAFLLGQTTNWDSDLADNNQSEIVFHRLDRDLLRLY